ncbi:head morphologies protein [Bacillus phage PSYJ-YH]|nr:head morphologies protein [Bacillus phage PSYJ-YH]
MTTKKHQWLLDEALKVHDAIDNDLAEYLEKLKVSYNVIFDKLIEEAESLLKKLDKGNITQERLVGRFSSLANQAQQRATELGLEMSREMPEKLRQYAQYSYDGMTEIIKVSGVAHALPVYSIEFLAGFNYEDYTFSSSVHKAGIRLGTKLNSILEEGISKGWNLQKYRNNLRKVTDFTIYEANRIARTETARVATEGAKRSFKEYDVERVEWVSTLEKRTCQRCASLHGKKFVMGQEPPLPLHPHCRCVLIPVLRGY